MRVRVDIGAGVGVGAGIFDLLVDRIGVDDDAHRAGQMLVAQAGGPAQIDQPVRLGVKPAHLLARQPVPQIVDRVPIGPAPAEPVTLHRPAQIGDVVVALHHHAGGARVVRIGPAIFDIPDLEAELFEAEQVVHRLPGDAGERHLADKVENEDRAARVHGVAPIVGSAATTAGATIHFRCRSAAARTGGRCGCGCRSGGGGKTPNPRRVARARFGMIGNEP